MESKLFCALVALLALGLAACDFPVKDQAIGCRNHNILWSRLMVANGELLVWKGSVNTWSKQWEPIRYSKLKVQKPIRQTNGDWSVKAQASRTTPSINDKFEFLLKFKADGTPYSVHSLYEGHFDGGTIKAEDLCEADDLWVEKSNLSGGPDNLRLNGNSSELYFYLPYQNLDSVGISRTIVVQNGEFSPVLMKPSQPYCELNLFPDPNSPHDNPNGLNRDEVLYFGDVFALDGFEFSSFRFKEISNDVLTTFEAKLKGRGPAEVYKSGALKCNFPGYVRDLTMNDINSVLAPAMRFNTTETIKKTVPKNSDFETWINRDQQEIVINKTLNFSSGRELIEFQRGNIIDVHDSDIKYPDCSILKSGEKSLQLNAGDILEVNGLSRSIRNGYSEWDTEKGDASPYNYYMDLTMNTVTKSGEELLVNCKIFDLTKELSFLNVREITGGVIEFRLGGSQRRPNNP